MTVGRIPSVEGGIQPTIFDAKANLLTATANDTPAILAVGSNDQVLTADSSTATGLKWAALPSSGFPAWTSYTPTVTCTSGTITTSSAVGFYSQSGKTVVVMGRITITTAGTGAGSLFASLPFTAQTRSGGEWVGSSIEGQLTGFGGWASITSGASIVAMRNYNFGTYIANTALVAFTITYEVA